MLCLHACIYYSLALTFCRYYVAEGVRSYAQETWQLAMGGRGRALVAMHIQQVRRCTGGQADIHLAGGQAPMQ